MIRARITQRPVLPGACLSCGQPVEASREPIMCGSSDREGPLTYWRCSQCRAIFSRLTASAAESTRLQERAEPREHTDDLERATVTESTICTERADATDSTMESERTSRHSAAKAEAVRG
jgi:hypothetical protein